MSRRCKYKTEAERKAARKATRNKAARAWARRNPDKIRAYQKKNRERILKTRKVWEKKNINKIKEWSKARYIKIKEALNSKTADTAAFEERIAKLESEIKDILLTLDECLKDNKKLENLIKWGTPKITQDIHII